MARSGSAVIATPSAPGVLARTRAWVPPANPAPITPKRRVTAAYRARDVDHPRPGSWSRSSAPQGGRGRDLVADDPPRALHHRSPYVIGWKPSSRTFAPTPGAVSGARSPRG